MANASVSSDVPDATDYKPASVHISERWRLTTCGRASLDHSSLVRRRCNGQGPVNEVLIVGTYLLTRCGVATFTSDVESALWLRDTEVMGLRCRRHQSNPLAISRDDEDSYTAIGRQINELGCDVVLIQHELGIHGGNAGANILVLTAVLEVPYVVTLHTVLPRFSDAQTDVLRNLRRNPYTHTTGALPVGRGAHAAR